MHPRIYIPATMASILALAVLGASTASAATLSKSAARKAAVAKMNAYLGTHPWASSGAVGKCTRKSPRRVTCEMTINGRSKVCRTVARVKSRKGGSAAKLQRLDCQSATLPRITHLRAYLGDKPARDLLNPFRATYSYGASATSEVVGDALSSEPTPPPAGVLALYSDGVLECAENVNVANPDATCPVDYDELGSYRVTTIYTSGSESATATMIHNVEPLPTSTSLSVSYEPLTTSTSHFGCGEDSQCLQTIGWNENGGFNVGTLTVSGAIEPWGSVPVSACPIPAGSCVALNLGQDGSVTFPVSVLANYVSLEEKVLPIGGLLAIEPESPKNVSLASLNQAPASDIEAGAYYFRVASGSRPGYASSEATAAIHFAPEVRSPVERVPIQDD